MKTYLVEFTHQNGQKEVVEFTTDKIDWSIEQWCRNRIIVDHKIIQEGTTNTKQMLFG